MTSIFRECPVPHHGACDAPLRPHVVIATVEDHGFEVRIIAETQAIEAWEPALIFPLDGGPARDGSAWVPVPTTTHALAAWLGY